MASTSGHHRAGACGPACRSHTTAAKVHVLRGMWQLTERVSVTMGTASEFLFLSEAWEVSSWKGGRAQHTREGPDSDAGERQRAFHFALNPGSERESSEFFRWPHSERSLIREVMQCQFTVSTEVELSQKRSLPTSQTGKCVPGAVAPSLMPHRAR